MKAVNYYLVVENIKESKKIGGLEVTDDLDEDNRYTKAKVIKDKPNKVSFAEVDNTIESDIDAIAYIEKTFPETN